MRTLFPLSGWGTGKEEPHPRMSLKAEYWLFPGMKEDSRKMNTSTLPTGLAIY